MSTDLQSKRIYRYHSDKHFSEFLPTRWRRKSTGIDEEQNYVTVTLCIRLVSRSVGARLTTRSDGRANRPPLDFRYSGHHQTSTFPSTTVVENPSYTIGSAAWILLSITHWAGVQWWLIRERRAHREVEMRQNDEARHQSIFPTLLTKED